MPHDPEIVFPCLVTLETRFLLFDILHGQTRVDPAPVIIHVRLEMLRHGPRWFDSGDVVVQGFLDYGGDIEGRFESIFPTFAGLHLPYRHHLQSGAARFIEHLQQRNPCQLIRAALLVGFVTAAYVGVCAGVDHAAMIAVDLGQRKGRAQFMGGDDVRAFLDESWHLGLDQFRHLVATRPADRFDGVENPQKLDVQRYAIIGQFVAGLFDLAVCRQPMQESSGFGGATRKPKTARLISSTFLHSAESQ